MNPVMYVINLFLPSSVLGVRGGTDKRRGVVLNPYDSVKPHQM